MIQGVRPTRTSDDMPNSTDGTRGFLEMILAAVQFSQSGPRRLRDEVIRQLTTLRAFDASSAADFSHAPQDRRATLDQLLASRKVQTDGRGRYWLRRRYEWSLVRLARWAPLAVFLAIVAVIVAVRIR
jgi:hypothetical protein